MFKNTLLVMFRNLIRQKGYSIINILGLALGVAATILILLVVQFELSFETMHPAADRIYRINSKTNMGGTADDLGVTPPALAPALESALPELEGITRMEGLGQMGINHENQILYPEHHAMRVDPDFLTMFSINLQSGDRETALDQPYTVLMSERYAKKVFGEIPEVGTQLVLTDDQPYTLTGIFADPPRNTMFQEDMLVSMASMPEAYNNIWGSMGLVTWVQLAPDTDPAFVAGKAEALLMEQIGSALERLGLTWTMSLYPMMDIHLHSAMLGDPDTNTPVLFVIGFSAIAGFILLLACINFVNLSTARSARRAMEVGVRKVMGANRGSLIRQFLGESTLYAFLSVLLAVAVVQVVLPEFRSLIQTPIEASQLLSLPMLGGLIGIVVVVGLISGAFPAFFLSAFQPIQVMKRGQAGIARGNMIRKVLVVGQFIVSIALIIGTITTYQQVRFLGQQDLGLGEAQVMRLWPSRELDTEKLRSVKEAIKTLPGVESVSMADSSPFGNSASKTVIDPDGAMEGESINVWVYQVDPSFFETYGMSIVNGRGFDETLATDNGGVVVLNEAAALSVNWTGDVLEGRIPIGQHRIAGDSPFHDPNAPAPGTPEAEDYEGDHLANIVGVVRDFNFMDLHSPIEPVMFIVNEDAASHLAIRVSSGDLEQTRNLVQETWEDFFPNEQVQIQFLDDAVRTLLESDRTFGNMIAAFAILAIIIASLGLFGLVSHTAEARTKELGVRKVLGASEPSLVVLLTKEFTYLVLIASVFAVPGAVWLMNQWLADFASRINIGVGIVLSSVIASLVLAWLSVAYQAIRAARRNPVESLRYE